MRFCIPKRSDNKAVYQSAAVHIPIGLLLLCCAKDGTEIRTVEMLCGFLEG